MLTLQAIAFQPMTKFELVSSEQLKLVMLLNWFSALYTVKTEEIL